MCDLRENSKIKAFVNFWCKNQSRRPLAIISSGETFAARNYESGKRLLIENKVITPDMINVDAFLEDYERCYQTSLLVGSDGFFTAEPYLGIPWLEAMAGCTVITGEYSFRTLEFVQKIDELEKIVFDEDNPWYRKYFEFIKKLVDASRGRYMVGQSILRGVSDVIGAVMGQVNMIYAVYDYPEEISRFAQKLAHFFIKLIKNQEEIIPRFFGGYAIGIYGMWCPEKCIWFQDDMSTLFSPDIYKKNIMFFNRLYSNVYNYSLMHLHPTSLYHLDNILSIDSLKAVNISRDTCGMPISDLLPHLKKIQDGHCLVINGAITEKEIRIILENLSYEGLCINLTCSSVEEANAQMNYIINHAR